MIAAIETDFVYFDKKRLWESEKALHGMPSSVYVNRSQFLDRFFDMPLEVAYKPRLAIFQNVQTNNYGLIAALSKSIAVRNGGCTHMGSPKYFSMGDPSRPLQKVISLSSGASGTWHFPMVGAARLIESASP